MLSMDYAQAATRFEEALPLGNGRMGAMVYGGVAQEKILFNDDTFYSGGPLQAMPQAADSYKLAREQALAGDYKQATQTIEANLLGNFTQGYLPLAHLLLDFSVGGGITEYSRSLALAQGLHTCSFCADGIRHTREAFVTHPGRAYIMKISACTPGSITLNARLDSLVRHSTHTADDTLVCKGYAPTSARPSYTGEKRALTYEEGPKRGMDFVLMAQFLHSGGTMRTDDERVFIESADAVYIYVCFRTAFIDAHTPPRSDSFFDRCEADLLAIATQEYDSARAAHIADFGALYNRVDIDFRRPGGAPEARPLDARLIDWEKSADDPALFALLFQYARYLSIAASRPDSRPMNLQGIWNEHLRPPWSGNFTININLQMNYWPQLGANLPECHMPVIDFLHTLRITGADVARSTFGAGGFAAGHNSDIWGHANLVGKDSPGFAAYAFWPLGGAWLAAHVMDHFEYTQDIDFLRNSWPILRDCARFLLDVMVEDSDGRLIFAPSTSPENRFIFGDEHLAVCETTAATCAVIKRSLQDLCHAADLLGIDDDLCAAAASALPKLPPLQIGSDGGIMEWSRDFAQAEPAHRHTSHLIPLYPFDDILPPGPLADAAAATLRLRGPEATGWALAWRICLWARLRDAESAFEMLKKQLRPATDKNGGCYPNLLGAHPPFQIDSNFGAAAGMLEMLVQSTPKRGTLTLLPALPRALGTGHVRGIVARGGICIDMEFAGGIVTRAQAALLPTASAVQMDVSVNGASRRVTFEPGVAVRLV